MLPNEEKLSNARKLAEDIKKKFPECQFSFRVNIGRNIFVAEINGRNRQYAAMYASKMIQESKFIPVISPSTLLGRNDRNYDVL